MLVTGSVHGTNDYMRWVGRSQEERCEQRKAARLCLDTSAHAGTEFQRLMTVLSNVSSWVQVLFGIFAHLDCTCGRCRFASLRLCIRGMQLYAQGLVCCGL